MYYVQWFDVLWHHYVSYKEKCIITLSCCRKWLCFYAYFSHIIYIYRGSLQDFYWKKGSYECIEPPCEHFCLKSNKVKYYWAHVLKNDTKIYEMDELIYHCLVSFENFHKQYIILTSLLFNPLLIEESSFVTVRSPPGFINR